MRTVRRAERFADAVAQPRGAGDVRAVRGRRDARLHSDNHGSSVHDAGELPGPVTKRAGGDNAYPAHHGDHAARERYGGVVSANPSSRNAGRRAVMYDVARLAGVSHQTVSRVINGSEHVRAETRDRVLAAMEKLDYRPNSVARALVTGRSKTLGVLTFN